MKYTTQELCQLLKISRDTLKRRREEILDYVALFWDYEIITEGRTNYFVVKEEYSTLAPLPRKTKTKEMKEFYSEKTHKIIKKKPWNSGSNIAREICATDNVFDHSEKTARDYVRPVLKNDFEIADDKQWMRINYVSFSYEPLSDEEISYLKEMFKKYIGRDAETIADIISEQRSGYLSKEEAYDKINNTYDAAMDKFMEKYGFRPIKVAKYELKNPNSFEK